MVALSDLRPHPRNYRGHPEDQLAHIEASIKEHGFYRNVVACKDGTVLAGHGVVEASKRLGLTEIPVIRLNIKPDDPRAIKVLTGDNTLAYLADNDDRALTELLKEIHETGDLLGTGFDDQMLAALAMVTRPASELANKDAANEWLGMPEHSNGTEEIKLYIRFRSEEDRTKLLRDTLGIENPRVRENIPTIWWPPREINDLSSVEFQGDDDA